MITQEQLKHLLTYEPITGNFIWNHRILSQNRPSKLGGRLAGVKADNRILIGIETKRYKAHRLAFLYMTGSIPKYIDHIDGNGFNNKWENLREATHSENMQNATISSNCLSGVKGITEYYGRTHRFNAELMVNGIRHRKSFSVSSYGTEAKAKAIEWLKEIRESYCGKFTNHG